MSMQAALLSVTFSLGIALSANAAPNAERVGVLRAFLEVESRPALDTVFSLLDSRDLLIFDDALHDAVEPWDFYRELLRDPRSTKIDTVFLEVLATSDQPFIDEFLAAPELELNLLYRALRDDLNGGGWPLQTYIDFLVEVYEVNRKRPVDQRLRVVGVSNPIYWAGFVDSVQYKDYRRVVDLNRDYTMYRVILEDMGDFDEGQKGLFLTNTRHAYKAIRNRRGRLYWNTGTFFHELHPGSSVAIRFHSAQLFLDRDPGTGQRKVRFGRLEEGNWDAAFASWNRRRIAVPLDHGPFGEAVYVGNHMMDSEAGQTLFDAYDYLIFLAPVETFRRSARSAAVFDGTMRRELERRLPIVFGSDLEESFKASDPAGRVSEWMAVCGERLHPLTQFPSF